MPTTPPLSVAEAAFSEREANERGGGGGGANERSSDYRAECEFLPLVVVAAAAVTTRRRCNNSVGFLLVVLAQVEGKKALLPPVSFSRLFAEGLKEWVSTCLRRGRSG